MKTRISEVLDAKGRRVFCVEPRTSVMDAVDVMNEQHVGSVVVLEEGRPVGILTERDILKRVVGTDVDPRNTPVCDIMTNHVYSLSEDDTVADAMSLMTRRRCRHVPIVDHGKLRGMLSIGDVTKALSDALREEVKDLESYISSPYLR